MGSIFEVSSGGVVQTNNITEKTLNNGVNIESVTVKDGLVDGVDVSTLNSQVSTNTSNISSLTTDVNGFPDELKNLTTAEIQQVENIGTATISAGQWGYLGALDQSVVKASEVTFAGVYVGTGSKNASATLQADSTTKGFLPPRMTTTQRDAVSTPATGLEVFDTTAGYPAVYNGSAWLEVPLNEALYTHTTTWGGAYSPAVSGADIKLYKLGQLVVFYLEPMASKSVSVNDTISATTVLPAAYRPTLGKVHHGLNVIASGTYSQGYVDISTSGAITISNGDAPTGKFSPVGGGTAGWEGISITYYIDL